MSLRDKLSADLKEAMKSGDAVRKTTIRNVMAALKEAEQRKREELVKQALKKHGIERPTETGEAALAAYQQAVEKVLAAEGVEAKSALDEGEELAAIQRLIKQRQDSIAEAGKAGRQDVAAAEQAELELLQAYLPAQMSREEIEAEARAVIAQVGASGPRDMGKVMGPLMSRLQGRADGKVISDVVRSLLSG
jgi:uncharacterized protein YqeY